MYVDRHPSVLYNSGTLYIHPCNLDIMRTTNTAHSEAYTYNYTRAKGYEIDTDTIGLIITASSKRYAPEQWCRTSSPVDC